MKYYYIGFLNKIYEVEILEKYSYDIELEYGYHTIHKYLIKFPNGKIKLVSEGKVLRRLQK